MSGQQGAQFTHDRKDLDIVVPAQFPPGFLLHFHNFTIFFKDPVRENTKDWPGHVQQERPFGFFDRQQTKRLSHLLGFTQWQVTGPQVHHQITVLVMDFEGLVRIGGTDGHNLFHRLFPTFEIMVPSEDQRLSQGLVATFTGKALAGLHKILARVLTEKTGRNRPHLTTVQELMVHVHQVLMHESIVAFQPWAELTGFEFRIPNLRHIWQRHRLGQCWVPGEKKEKPTALTTGKTPNGGANVLRVRVGNRKTRTTQVKRQARTTD